MMNTAHCTKETSWPPCMTVPAITILNYIWMIHKVSNEDHSTWTKLSKHLIENIQIAPVTDKKDKQNNKNLFFNLNYLFPWCSSFSWFSLITLWEQKRKKQVCYSRKNLFKFYLLYDLILICNELQLYKPKCWCRQHRVQHYSNPHTPIAMVSDNAEIWHSYTHLPLSL